MNLFIVNLTIEQAAKLDYFVKKLHELVVIAGGVPFNAYERVSAAEAIIHWLPKDPETRMWGNKAIGMSFRITFKGNMENDVREICQYASVLSDEFVNSRSEGFSLINMQYENYCKNIVTNGTTKTDRTGTGTTSLFGSQMRFNLNDGFPLINTKQVHLKSIIVELLWFLRGDTNIKYLNDNGVSIWDEWADANGDLGPVYGSQWRSWPGRAYSAAEPLDDADKLLIPGDDIASPYSVYQESIDQIKQAIHMLKTNPDSRRIIVSAWNVAQVVKMALPPCHALFQFYVENNRLSCQLYQR